MAQCVGLGGIGFFCLGFFLFRQFFFVEFLALVFGLGFLGFFLLGFFLFSLFFLDLQLFSFEFFDFIGFFFLVLLLFLFKGNLRVTQFQRRIRGRWRCGFGWRCRRWLGHGFGLRLRRWFLQPWGGGLGGGRPQFGFGLNGLGLGFPGRGQAQRQEQQHVDNARDHPGTPPSGLCRRRKFEVRHCLGVQSRTLKVQVGPTGPRVQCPRVAGCP